MRTVKKSVRNMALGAVSLAAIAAAPIAEAADWVAEARAEGDQAHAYRLEILTEIFDGARDFSHARSAGFARVRRGDVSYVQLDMGPSAVVISSDAGVALGNFESPEPIEADFIYDYGTHEMRGANAVSKTFNAGFGRYLKDGPALGSDAEWTKTIALRDLGVKGARGGSIAIDLTRRYFSYDGVDYVLVTYKTPAFEYSAGGAPVLHWGEGAALLDATMSELFWNAALHRSLAGDDPSDARPYRFAKTIAMIDETGTPALDPRMLPVAARAWSNFYGPGKTDDIDFVSSTMQPDQTPVEIAAKLDMLAISIAENSGNQVGEISGQNLFGEQQENVRAVTSTAETLRVLENVHTALEKGAGRARVVEIFAEGGVSADAAMQTLIDQNEQRISRYQTHRQTTGTLLANAGSDLKSLNDRLETLQGKTATIMSDKVGARYYTNAERAAHLEEYKRMLEAQQEAKRRVEQLLAMDTVQAAELEKMRRRSETLVEGLELAGLVQPTRVGYAKSLIVEAGKLIPPKVKSMGSKTLTTLGVVGTGVTAGVSGYNVNNYNKTGDVVLTGSYAGLDPNASATDDVIAALTGVGLDLFGVAAVAYSGNVPGAAMEAINIVTRAGGDIYMSGSALRDINQLNYELTVLNGKLENELREKRVQLAQRNADAYVDGLLYQPDERKGYDLSDPRFDPNTGYPKADYWAWLRANDPAALRRMGIDPSWPVGRIPSSDRGRDPNAKSPAQIQQEFEEAFIDKTPQADRAKIEEAKRKQEELRRRKAEEAGNEPVFSDGAETIGVTVSAEIARELNEYQARKLAERADANADFFERAREAGFDFDPVTFDPVTFDPVTFDPVVFTPVTFTPVTWTPPEWTPPEWTPPEFTPPKASEIKINPLGGDGWLGDIESEAYGYKDLSFTFETDPFGFGEEISEWLAGQNIAQLERWARDAGLYTLANAIDHMDYLINLTQNPSFRRYAMGTPACSPTLGCGPDPIGEMRRRRSLLALGDALATAGDATSTAGLSDIIISSFALSWIMSDFGVEDGDIIDIVVSQFGRELFRTRHTLRNAGTGFNVNIGTGVAVLQIRAVNEGDLSPNTAQIDVQNVVSGESTQEYSLNTGQTATLRVESGK